MFSRFTNALYNAMDALAPPLPLREDFEWHWKSVTRFYSGKNASNKIPIEMTSIPGHLTEMLSILEQEEKEVEIGNIGPCMEYIMQHKLLDTMCVLGTSDAPPGMKHYMFKFITSFLHITQQSLIPHVSIYTPIQNFIKLCGEVLAGPTENEEMEFLQSICDKLNENPHLVNCFLGPFDNSSRRNSESSASGKSTNSTCEEKEYALISSLLRLYQSPDNSISIKAGECLKICCSCANDASAMTIAQCTNLSHQLCECLGILYKNIPKTIKLCDIENPNGSEGDDENTKISPEKRKYLHYLQQLSFTDTVVNLAHPLIGDHLCTCFREEFLSVYLFPDLINKDNEDDILFSTTLTSSSLHYISSPKLIAAFGIFLLGDDDNCFEFSERSSHIVKDTLIERCRNHEKSLAVAMSSLQLFEELLQRPTQHILHNLVIKNLENRGYYDHTAVDSWLQFSEDDACSRFSDDQSSDSPPRKSSLPTYIHRIIDCFLALLPNEIKSCEEEEDSGYETYLKEAHLRFMKCLAVCENFEWPLELEEKEDYHLGAEDDSSSESQPEADSARWAFFEGPFMSMIFDKLEQMLHQPYEINLQVTSIVSHLALFAHSHLHEYLLNPLIPYNPDARSLFLVLFKVSEDIQKAVPNIRGFKTKIKLTRNALLSDGNEYATFEESNVLEALIVLEEFCKELAAIAFVKYNADS